MKKRTFLLLAAVILCAGCATSVSNPSARSDVANYQSGLREYDSGDFKAAIREFTASANEGYPPAQFKLGYMFIYALGVKQNLHYGYELLLQAAQQGDADAELLLGHLYETGYYIVSQDTQQAFLWYSKAASQGNARAENNLGTMYKDGEWVAQDYAKAFNWYQIAANQKDALAIYNIANMYMNGYGLPKNQTKAITTYKLAADMGSIDADLLLAAAYRDGLYGLAKDAQLSTAYFEKISKLEPKTWDQFFDALHKIINAHKQYPKNAMNQNVSGIAVVGFEDLNGLPTHVTIQKSSGSSVLDTAAIEAVKDSAFPTTPVPVQDKLKFSIPIIYCLAGPCMMAMQ